MSDIDMTEAARKLEAIRQRQAARLAAQADETLAALVARSAKPSRKNARSERVACSNNGWS